MGSNSSVPAKKTVAPSKRPKLTTLSPATPSAKGPSNPTALRFIAMDTNHDKTSMLEQATTALDKGTTPGESSPHAQVMQDSEWLSREVERLVKKELDLEKRENHLRERRLEMNEEKQRLSTKEEDVKLRKLKVELKRKEFDGEKKRLQKRYDWPVAEGVRQQRGESWLDGGQSRIYFYSNFGQHASPSPYPFQNEWERERRTQTEEKTKDQRYRFKEIQLKREVEELKREDERLRKKERRIQFEEAEVDREVKRLIECNKKVDREDIKLRDDENDIRLRFDELKRTERDLEEKEKENRPFKLDRESWI